MYRTVVREITDTLKGAQDLSSDPIIVGDGCRCFNHQVDLPFRQSIYLTQFADDTAILKGGHGTNQSRMGGIVTFEDIVEDLIPFLPGEVEIKVGRSFSFRIQEPLKV